MNKIVSLPHLFWLHLFVGVILFTAFANIGVVDAVNTVPISVIVEKIEQDEVDNIIILRDKVEVHLKDGTQLVTGKESGVSFSESLKKRGVNADKLQKINIEIKDDHSFDNWYLSFLPIGIYIGWLSISYVVVLFGTNFFSIGTIEHHKIMVYVLAEFMGSLLLSQFTSSLQIGSLPKYSSYITQFIVSSLLSLLLLRYLFGLTGKKLWQFFVYLIIINIIFSSVVTFWLYYVYQGMQTS